MKSLLSLLLMCSFLTAGLQAADAAPVYELRIYTVLPGKMPDMLARFRDHTCALFEKHGMVNIGYWLPLKEEEAHKLHYVVKHASREAAKASWTAFVNDPVWIKARDASEAAGKIVASIESVYLATTDYSPAVPALTGNHIYLLAHDSVEAAKKSFDSFRQDPDWVKARTESEKDGPLLASPPSSLFLKPVDFSKLQ